MDILIIGLGSIGTRHISAIKKIEPLARIFALRSAKDMPLEDNIINIYDINELTTPPHFAIISNPTYLHGQTIKTLSALKVPLFIEKPVLHTLDQADELCHLIAQNGIITYVACNMRFHPCLLFVQSYLNECVHRINEVNIYCGSYLPDWRPGKNFRDIYSANRNMGGGVHLDIFHEIDYAIWLFGYPEKNYTVQTSKSSLNIDAVDYANYTFGYADFTMSIILNYYRRDAKRTVEIVFDDKTLTVDLLKGNVMVGNKKIFNVPDYSVSSTYIDQMRYFINCLQSGRAPANSFQESVKILELCF